MTQAEMINEIQKQVETTKATIDAVLKAFAEVSMVMLAKNPHEKIPMFGLGTLGRKNVPPRVGRNPKTGEKLEIPAKVKPVFSPSKELKQELNPN